MSKRQKIEDISDIADGIRSGNRRALARGITLIESSRSEDLEAGQQLLETLMPYTGNSVRVGISGVPGVGKSTFIESLGIKSIARGQKVAVLAVDPSSPYSGGSIMGDKTRMQDLSASEAAFIRPSPTGGTLGGVARKTRESMLLCEAAGYDFIMIETVGVGQSEYEVAHMVDFFLVMLLPGGGDALQGIKKGIIEVADMLVINKAEGEQLELAKIAKKEYHQALKLVASDHDYEVAIKLCSALNGDGIEEIRDHIQKLTHRQAESGQFERRRKQQLDNWMRRLTEQTLLTRLWQDERVSELAEDLKKQLQSGQTTPVNASRKLIGLFLENSGNG